MIVRNQDRLFPDHPNGIDERLTGTMTSSVRQRCFAFLVLLLSTPLAVAAQTFRTSIPSQFAEACDIDRDDLHTTLIASNADVYPGLAVSVPGGWLVYDRYSNVVIELTNDLVEIRRWGRHGPGPLEYQIPVGLTKTPDGVQVVDRSPPSLLRFGRRSVERRLDLPTAPVHSVDSGGLLRVAGSDGSVYTVTAGGDVSVLLTPSDFGLPDAPEGALPVLYLRDGYAAFRGPSTIWTLDGGSRVPSPRQLLQRCVPPPLRNVHELAPKLTVAGRQVPYTVHTLQDFRVLTNGMILALGGLKVGDEEFRSIERYRADGQFDRAWQLPYPNVRGAFHSSNPRWLLIWNDDEFAGIRLIEVSNLDYLGTTRQ